MPYNLKVTANSLDISEREIGSNDEIRFSSFTSCIGIIGYQIDEFTGPSVLGIHLGMYSDEKELFDISVAQKVIQLLTDCQETVIVGCVTMWSKDNVKLAGPYASIITALGKQGKKTVEINTGDGKYGGKLKENGIEIYCKDTYCSVEKLSAQYIGNK
jgi:hypothetical protein